MAGSEDQTIYLQAGIRAAQTTPLFSRAGKLVGMISTHWKKPHQPSERDLSLLDILARQAADLIERKHAEIEVQTLNACLEERVRLRTAELEAANRELEGFTFATSHDLRAPLGRINSFSSLLEKQYRDRLEGNGLVYLEYICQNSARLIRLVDELLNHARVAQQNLEVRPISIPTLVQAVLQEYAEEIQETGADVRVQLPPAEVLGDSQCLAQVLGNLLQNALQYSAKTRLPVIQISGEITERKFRLSIQDNGIGFNMAYHDKIFEIFQRLHTYSEYVGTGVGLALVKRSMERMGGRVWAQSEQERGSVFFLELQTATSGNS